MCNVLFMLQEELALSYIEVSPIFQKIAATRGLFGLGFAPEFFLFPETSWNSDWRCISRVDLNSSALCAITSRRSVRRYRLLPNVPITDDDGSKLWFLRCLREIGEHPMHRAMGNFKELYIVEKQY